MAISEKDIKLLWGRAAGRCSKPGCDQDLTRILPQGSFVLGEMAHVIAQSVGGPRGTAGGGSDNYDNLILLCPTHHREIDKAPAGMYTATLLTDWKAKHEKRIRELGSLEVFNNFYALCMAVRCKLLENRQIWQSLGPNSEAAERDPSSNVSRIWQLRKLDSIVPNNTYIINIIGQNISLLSSSALLAFYAFKTHAVAFEQNQYSRLDNYPLFPAEFEGEFSP